MWSEIISLSSLSVNFLFKIAPVWGPDLDLDSNVETTLQFLTEMAVLNNYICMNI